MEKTQELSARQRIVPLVKMGVAALAFVVVKLTPRPPGLSPEAMPCWRCWA